ncbi:MAG TPA: guanylate kinase [Pyrinomonadaceae bacterium]
MLSESAPSESRGAAGEEADAHRGRLFIVSSPSGGGKGTLIRHVLKSVPGISYSISWTTRARRAGEIDGVHYHFVSEDEFREIRERDGFLEWAIVHGNSYGTARSVVEQELGEGHDIILEIDVQGAESVRAATNDSVSVFILPPSFAVLRERLRMRGTDEPATVALRLRNARDEVRRYQEFDYVIINDDAQRAARQLAAVVYAERARRDRQEWIARRVLASFMESSPVE